MTRDASRLVCRLHAVAARLLDAKIKCPGS